MKASLLAPLEKSFTRCPYVAAACSKSSDNSSSDRSLSVVTASVLSSSSSSTYALYVSRSRISPAYPFLNSPQPPRRATILSVGTVSFNDPRST
ncbi:hypothetical protein HanXRQr2_Chr06g0255591 [Helianthus annuus]|uniref:Uncharacterized protein n=1 Tax=Helianthus annuus TaxID=4232 RepID=A0A9K3ISI7_HELAN|nr:hypothetical protein HanXRQr2_Chr06g0255591 [Helianthus annuus]KAJ0915162.1 hypothetical protein HanPSC8_Chr06g0246771 [Helianthus annuus]